MEAKITFQPFRTSWNRPKGTILAPEIIENLKGLGTKNLKYNPPTNLDKFDSANYQFNQELGRHQSIHIPKFTIGQLDELSLQVNPRFTIPQASVPYSLDCDKYFSGLSSFLVIRRENFSIYLVDGHRWAYWAWMEGMARGDIESSDLTLVHIDKHPDGEKPRLSSQRNDLDLKQLETIPSFEKIKNLISEHNGIDYHYADSKLNGIVRDNTFIWIAQKHHLFKEIFSVSKELFWESYEDDPESLGMPLESKREEMGSLGLQFKTLKAWVAEPSERRKTILDIDCDTSSAEEIIDFLCRSQRAGLNPGLVTIALSPGEFANYSDVTDAPWKITYMVDPENDKYPFFRDNSLWPDLHPLLPTLIDLWGFGNTTNVQNLAAALNNFPNLKHGGCNDALLTLSHFNNMIRLADEFINNW